MKKERNFAQLAVFTLLSAAIIPILNNPAADAASQNSVASMYVDAPFVQGSYATNYGGVTESFDDLSAPQQINSESADSHTAIGYVVDGTINVNPAGTPFGAITTSSSPSVNGSTTQYAGADDYGFTIHFATPVRYVGFWWSAGNAGNTVSLYSRGTLMASMDTTQLYSILGSVPANENYEANQDAISSVGGTSYLKKYYFGNPGFFTSTSPTQQGPAEATPGEAFAYIHAFATNSQSFDEIKFSGHGYEMDNLTISTQNVPILDSLVFLSEVEANCTSESFDEGNGTTTIKYQGDFCFFRAPAGVGRISIIAVAGGGGGGGTCVGGGGGAGGFYRNESYLVTGVLQMRLGHGGQGGYNEGCYSSAGSDGQNTEITMSGSTRIIYGGGGGGSFLAERAGRNGGSGGGGSGDGDSVTNSGGLGTPQQGNDGGSGFGGIYGNPAGGGGGFSSPGSSGLDGQGGDGGSGFSLTIFGLLQHFSGGGGGSSDISGGEGGESCGGHGSGATTGQSTTEATGFGCGGGGGDGDFGATAGSDGVVFVTYTPETITEVNSCYGAGTLVNGDFEVLPTANLIDASEDSNNNDVGTWHGYVWPYYYGQPRQILFLYDDSDSSPEHQGLRITGWNTTEEDHNIEIQRQVPGYEQDGNQTGPGYFDTSNGSPASGNYYAELNAKSASTLYQVISTIPGTTIRWSLKHRGRKFSYDGIDTMKVLIGPDLDNAQVQTGDLYNGEIKKFSSQSGSEYSVPIFDSTPTSVNSYGELSDSLDSGWSLYTGVYQVPENQTQTVFAFQSNDGDSTLGNYLDDIQFTPLIACPASVSVVAGRTSTINPFDINQNGNVISNDVEDSFGWANAFVSGLDATSGTVSSVEFGGVENRAIQYRAPSTPGNYLIHFTIGNPQGDFSKSTYSVSVLPDSKSRAPSEIPVDPRTTNLKLGLTSVTSATDQVIACIQQSNSSGNVINGSLRFDIGNADSPDTTVTTNAGVVSIDSDQSNYVRLRGAISAVNLALKSLKIYRSATPARLSSVFRVRFSSVVTGMTLYNPSDCSDARNSQIKILKIRPITLTQIRSFTVTPKNGQSRN